MNNFSSDTLFTVKSDDEFKKLTLQVFRYQADQNTVYKKFLKNLGITADAVREISDIPFLPIEFFKSHTIICENDEPEIVFTSSGTSGAIQSKHPVKDLMVYRKSFKKGFEKFYGAVKEYTILALLPSYLEREGSSLIFMIDELIQDSKNTSSGYFLYNHYELFKILNQLKEENKKVILIGVTYALLDFIENHQLDFPDLIIMETGGMKGKRKEMIREELHEILCQGFGVKTIHSEYGMTELLSQAYSNGEGKFICPPWMQICIRDINDPFSFLKPGLSGGINVIDLANINSSSFIATQDLGKINTDGTFEILGRFDNSDIRGCNLLIQ